MYKKQPEHPRTQAASAIEEWQRSEKKNQVGSLEIIFAKRADISYQQT